MGGGHKSVSEVVVEDRQIVFQFDSTGSGCLHTQSAGCASDRTVFADAAAVVVIAAGHKDFMHARYELN